MLAFFVINKILIKLLKKQIMDNIKNKLSTKEEIEIALSEVNKTIKDNRDYIVNRREVDKNPNTEELKRLGNLIKEAISKYNKLIENDGVPLLIDRDLLTIQLDIDRKKYADFIETCGKIGREKEEEIEKARLKEEARVSSYHLNSFISNTK